MRMLLTMLVGQTVSAGRHAQWRPDPDCRPGACDPLGMVRDLRAGARMVLNNSVQVEASGGYLSFGQSRLDVWEGKFQVSFGF